MNGDAHIGDMTAAQSLGQAIGFFEEFVDSPYLMILLVAGLWLIALWSALARTQLPSSNELRVPRLRNLFLGMCFRPVDQPVSAKGDLAGKGTSVAYGEEYAHVMSLDLRTATIISHRPLSKGVHIRVKLNSLPGYPRTSLGAPLGAEAGDQLDRKREVEPEVEAEVVACRALGDDPPTYFVKVRFLALDPQIKLSLRAYLQDLARSPRFSPA